MNGDSNASVKTKEKGERFTAWLDQPTQKLLISLLPPLTTELQQDTFTTLLRAAFDTGYDTGSGQVVGEMLKGMIESRDRRLGFRPPA
jgi:hypothetical protein